MRITLTETPFPSLEIDRKKTKLSNKEHGFGILFNLFTEGKISTPTAISLGKEVLKLNIPDAYDPKNKYTLEEFSGIINFFERKLESEKTGVPATFICTGCGNHLFMIGKDFIISNLLWSKGDALDAIKLLFREGLITKQEHTHLWKELEVIKFRQHISFLRGLGRLIAGTGITRVRIIRS